jgi:hypothetical protein
VQSAKGTKTLDPTAGKTPIGARSMHGFENDDHLVLRLNPDRRIGRVLG